VETPEQRLKRIRVQERVILLHPTHVDRELKICNRDDRKTSTVSLGLHLLGAFVTMLTGGGGQTERKEKKRNETKKSNRPTVTDRLNDATLEIFTAMKFPDVVI